MNQEMENDKQLPRSAPQHQDSEEMEIDLLELLRYYLSKWYFFLALLIVGAVIAGAFTYYFVTPKFTATSKLYMVANSGDTIVDLSDFNIGNSLSSDYEELIVVRPILEQIIEEEDLEYTYEELKSMITISTINNTRILKISVVSTSPTEAMTVANALADKAVEEIPVMMDTAKPNIAERAIIPDKKSSPSMSKNVMIGGLIGVLLVGVILTVIYLMDDTMITAEDVEKALGFMPLTVIPEGDIQKTYDTTEYTGKKGKKGRKKI